MLSARGPTAKARGRPPAVQTPKAAPKLEVPQATPKPAPFSAKAGGTLPDGAPAGVLEDDSGAEQSWRICLT